MHKITLQPSQMVCEEGIKCITWCNMREFLRLAVCPDQALQAPPRAVDFTVPAGVRVVTVTGPNTGGKTAALKALGLTALMPKAGLFLPLEPPTGTPYTCEVTFTLTLP